MASKRVTVLSAKGNRLTRDPARIEFAAKCLRKWTYSKTERAIVNRFGVHFSTAQQDIAAARKLIGLEFTDLVAVREQEAIRLARVADQTEELARDAAKNKDYQGTAALRGRVIQASKEIARLTGAAAPRELKVTHTGSIGIDVELKVDLVLAKLETVLPPDILAAFLKGMELLAEAEERGVFKELEAPLGVNVPDEELESAIDDADKN